MIYNTSSKRINDPWSAKAYYIARENIIAQRKSCVLAQSWRPVAFLWRSRRVFSVLKLQRPCKGPMSVTHCRLPRDLCIAEVTDYLIVLTFDTIPKSYRYCVLRQHKRSTVG